MVLGDSLKTRLRPATTVGQARRDQQVRVLLSRTGDAVGSY